MTLDSKQCVAFWDQRGGIHTGKTTAVRESVMWVWLLCPQVQVNQVKNKLVAWVQRFQCIKFTIIEVFDYKLRDDIKVAWIGMFICTIVFSLKYEICGVAASYRSSSLCMLFLLLFFKSFLSIFLQLMLCNFLRWWVWTKWDLSDSLCLGEGFWRLSGGTCYNGYSFFFYMSTASLLLATD